MTAKQNKPHNQNPLLPPTFYNQRDWIDTLLPHENIGKRARPLFALEVRGMHRQPNDLKAATIRQLKRMVSGALVVYGVLLTMMVLFEGMGVHIYGLLWMVIACLLAFSLVDKFVLDYAGVMAGVGSHHDDRRHRELVLLTGLRNEEIIYARHAAAQVRVWGLLVLFVCLRVIVVIMTILTIILPILLAPQYVDPLFSLKALQLENAASTITTLLGFMWLFASIGIGGAIYILEPIWRLRALTAAGLLAASSTLPESDEVPRHAAQMLMRLWGHELLIWGGAGLVIVMTLGLIVLVLPLGLGAVGWFIYSTHDRLTTRWLQEAHHLTTLDVA